MQGLHALVESESLYSLSSSCGVRSEVAFRHSHLLLKLDSAQPLPRIECKKKNTKNTSHAKHVTGGEPFLESKRICLQTVYHKKQTVTSVFGWEKLLGIKEPVSV